MCNVLISMEERPVDPCDELLPLPGVKQSRVRLVTQHSQRCWGRTGASVVSWMDKAGTAGASPRPASHLTAHKGASGETAVTWLDHR